VEAGHNIELRQVPCLLQIVEEIVALRIHIGCCVMCDLTCRVTEASLIVEDGGSYPNRAAVRVNKRGAPMPRVLGYGIT
jgi:hypothetical protein